MSTQEKNVKTLTALVFGATGVSGWGLCKQLAEYPTPETFGRIILLSLHPTSIEKASLPTDERITLHSGIDLNKPVDDITIELAKVPGITKVTHVFYNACGMSPTYDFGTTADMNVTMTKSALSAISAVAPHVKHFGFQSGSIVYGIPFAGYLLWAFKQGPFHEDYPRIMSPFSKMVSAYGQEDAVKATATENSWTWSSVRADTIVGFTPQPNPHCLSQSLGVYLSFYRHLYGANAEINFPGNTKAWASQFTMVGQNQLGRFNIHAALHPETLPAPQINISNGETLSWREIWAPLVAYFQLVGLPPASKKHDRWGAKWYEGVKGEAAILEQKYGLMEGYVAGLPWQYLDFLLTLKTDRVLNIDRARNLGYEHSSSTVANFTEAWDMMKAVKIIP